MKTTIGKVATSVLQEHGLKVVTKDAGSFFRVVTKATLGELAATPVHELSEGQLDETSRKVIETGLAFDVERTWHGLHEPEIDHMVGKVSRAPHVQAAGVEWWDITADGATQAGADALVLDGRNPRDRLTPWLTKNESGIALELFCECDPAIAAERTLIGNGATDLTDSALVAMEQSIVDRRRVDSARPSLPYRRPATFVDHHPDLTAEELVRQAWSDGKPDFPLPIRLDTGRFEREPMNMAVGSLVLAATSLVQ